MKTPSENLSEALAAIRSLRLAAVRGDAEAAAGLLEIATATTGHVTALTLHPPDRPAPAILSKLAAAANRWPVNVPIIEEERAAVIAASLPSAFGKGSPIRTTANRRGRPRDFDPESRAGFAANVIDDLIASRHHAFPYGRGADEIIEAAMAMLEVDTQGDWECFPWPAGIKADSTREAKSIRTVVERWLRDGLKSLV